MHKKAGELEDGEESNKLGEKFKKKVAVAAESTPIGQCLGNMGKLTKGQQESRKL
jgi:hypothetical protein